jgi:hypothetical protein
MIKSPKLIWTFPIKPLHIINPSSNTFCLTRNPWVTTPHTCKYMVFKFNQQVQQFPTKNCKLIDWRWRIFNFLNCYRFPFYKIFYIYILWRCQIIFECSHPSAHNHQYIKCLLSCRIVGVRHMQNIPQHESATMTTSQFGLCCSEYTPHPPFHLQVQSKCRKN